LRSADQSYLDDDIWMMTGPVLASPRNRAIEAALERGFGAGGLDAFLLVHTLGVVCDWEKMVAKLFQNPAVCLTGRRNWCEPAQEVDGTEQ